MSVAFLLWLFGLLSIAILCSNSCLTFETRAWCDPSIMPTLTRLKQLPHELRKLLACVWPYILILEAEAGSRTLDGHELMCGAAELSYACLNAGLAWMGYDKLIDAEYMNIMLPQ